MKKHVMIEYAYNEIKYIQVCYSQERMLHGGLPLNIMIFYLRRYFVINGSLYLEIKLEKVNEILYDKVVSLSWLVPQNVDNNVENN